MAVPLGNLELRRPRRHLALAWRGAVGAVHASVARALSLCPRPQPEQRLALIARLTGVSRLVRDLVAASQRQTTGTPDAQLVAALGHLEARSVAVARSLKLPRSITATGALVDLRRFTGQLARLSAELTHDAQDHDALADVTMAVSDNLYDFVRARHLVDTAVFDASLDDDLEPLDGSSQAGLLAGMTRAT
jgi:hypothetical protein